MKEVNGREIGTGLCPCQGGRVPSTQLPWTPGLSCGITPVPFRCTETEGVP